jgi:hypothetical protein
MKMLLTFLLLLGFVFGASAQIVTNQSARLKTKVVFYEGKIGSGIMGSSIDPSPEDTMPGSKVRNEDTSGGQKSELAWTFVGRSGDKDVYHFTFSRMTKAGVSAKVTTSKDVLFDGRRAVIFEDDLHTVLIESPTAEDLKQAAEQQPHG